MNLKFDNIKKKLKKYAPELICAATTVYAAVLIVKTSKLQSSLNQNLEELEDFLGKGPDYITIDKELADEFDNGAIYEYTLADGVRIALMKAHKED